MPELPEVETVANGVDARVRGQRIVGVWTSGKPQTFKSPESEIAETLTGAKIVRIWSAVAVKKQVPPLRCRTTTRKAGARAERVQRSSSCTWG